MTGAQLPDETLTDIIRFLTVRQCRQLVFSSGALSRCLCTHLDANWMKEPRAEYKRCMKRMESECRCFLTRDRDNDWPGYMALIDLMHKRLLYGRYKNVADMPEVRVFRGKLL